MALTKHLKRRQRKMTQKVRKWLKRRGLRGGTNTGGNGSDAGVNNGTATSETVDTNASSVAPTKTGAEPENTVNTLKSDVSDSGTIAAQNIIGDAALNNSNSEVENKKNVLNTGDGDDSDDGVSDSKKLIDKALLSARDAIESLIEARNEK
jgi:hypothetical protein